ncbi:MarR family winged helix-turn-helix transcriptional regulator [Longispora albida]|uniref:MarR family winged helix-turn-helix transcriptional regulator n=1 Tax=Longispora albida TaxID=203523 RepID=UPI0003A7B1C7|nr:MarR family transcriptional regulator [Longispora albida]
MTTEAQLVSTWRALLERYHATSCALDRALNDGHQLGMSEFEVLERLVEAENDGGPAIHRRVQELATSVHLSQSALSRVVARLERDGLALRVMCPSDRRGIYVQVTEEGRERYAAARVTHRAILAETLGSS